MQGSRRERRCFEINQVQVQNIQREAALTEWVRGAGSYVAFLSLPHSVILLDLNFTEKHFHSRCSRPLSLIKKKKKNPQVTSNTNHFPNEKKILICRVPFKYVLNILKPKFLLTLGLKLVVGPTYSCWAFTVPQGWCTLKHSLQ